jgi:hypothetical protein
MRSPGELHGSSVFLSDSDYFSWTPAFRVSSQPEGNITQAPVEVVLKLGIPRHSRTPSVRIRFAALDVCAGLYSEAGHFTLRVNPSQPT